MLLNLAQVNGIVRILIPAICAFLATHGLSYLGSADVQTQVVAVVLALAAAVWSYFAHSNAAVLKNAANIDPGIAIKVPDHIAAKDHAVQKLIDDNVKWPQIQAHQA